jgi:hypothetical protein
MIVKIEKKANIEKKINIEKMGNDVSVDIIMKNNVVIDIQKILKKIPKQVQNDKVSILERLFII